MRKTLTVAFFFFAVSAFAQVEKGSSILFFRSNFPAAPDTTYSAEWAWDLSKQQLFFWDRSESAWAAFSGNRIFQIAALADTSTISNPLMADVAYVDSTLMAFRGNEEWLVFSGSSDFILYTDATLSYSNDSLSIAQQGAQPGQVLKWNGTAWAPAADNAGGTSAQDTIYFAADSGPSALATNGTTMTISGSGRASTSISGNTITVDVSNVDDNDASAINELQSLSRAGNNVSLSLGGGTVSIADDDSDPGNEIQSISSSLSGSFLSLSLSGANTTNIAFVHDGTTKGNGTTLSPLGIDSALVATRFYVDSLVSLVSGVFESVGGVVRSTAPKTDDFVFGSPQLDDSGVIAEDNRFFFDKSKAYFFAGSVVGDQADDVNRGFNGSNFGYNHTVSGFAAAAIGGQDGEASGSRSVALGGVSNEAASTNSVAMGDKAKAHLPTTLAHSGGDFRINGDAQYLRIVANGGGFGTAPFNLNINGTGGTRLTVPQNSSWSYSANCLITVIDAGTSSSEKGDSRSLHCYGLIQNTNGNIYHSGSTAYAYNDADLDMNTAAVTFIGDNTNDALRIAVTPPQGGSGSATSTTWAVCTVEATQIVYDGL